MSRGGGRGRPFGAALGYASESVSDSVGAWEGESAGGRRLPDAAAVRVESAAGMQVPVTRQQTDPRPGLPRPQRPAGAAATVGPGLRLSRATRIGEA